MSAIARDREIAARATQGEWTEDGWSEKVSDSAVMYADPAGEGDPDNAEDWLLLAEGIASSYDAEHIARLHNRQPLYDKLVDAVRAWTLAMDSEEAKSNLYDALRDLDREKCACGGCPGGKDCPDGEGSPAHDHARDCPYLGSAQQEEK